MASTVPLVALKKHSYGKGSLTPGQAFEAPERDAKLLVQLGIAKKASETPHPEQPIVKPSPLPKPTPPIAEVPPPEVTPLPTSDEAEPMTTKKRGTYRRRDLTAEGDE
jgi:hypothetical protein